jgi:membrane protease YdiL (CAAX protease family)
MNTTKPRFWGVVLLGLVCCGIMALVDGLWQPGYATKSAVKLAVFGVLPLIVTRLWGLVRFRELFLFRKKGFLTALVLGLGIYALILVGYFLLRNVFDFSGIAGSLTENAGVTKDNFLYVSLYISFANSLLEEFFFRGFLFRNLKEHSSPLPAYGISAVLFAAYHIAMMIGWFGFGLNALVLLGLTAGGLIFNWLNEKLGCIYGSWLTHMFANFAINTIGFLLLT